MFFGIPRYKLSISMLKINENQTDTEQSMD